MKSRLAQLLAERRKAIAAGLSSVIVALVYVVSGVNLDPGLAAVVAGAVVTAVVHEVPNASSS